jgi:urea transport system permease protein
LTLTVNRLWIILFAVLVLLSLIALLRWSGLGRGIRAVMQNRRMAAAMGIRTPRIDALTFGLDSGIAGVAGGVGNLWGTLVGAMTLGIVDKFVEPFFGAVLGKVLVLVLLILFIQRRPRDLFPVKGRAAEA